MVRESPNKNSKNVSFRATSLMTNNNNHSNNYTNNTNQNFQESQRYYRSLSPNKNNLDSYSTTIGHQPKIYREKCSPEKSRNNNIIYDSNSSTYCHNKNVYFAQAIGQGRVLINRPNFNVNNNSRNNENKNKDRHLNRSSNPINENINNLSLQKNERSTSAERIMEIHTSPIRKDTSSYIIFT